MELNFSYAKASDIKFFIVACKEQCEIVDTEINLQMFRK